MTNPPTLACASCKYQRRRCTHDCPLAPYFPADKPNDFLNAHKLFGVSNILKILKNAPNEHKRDAMRSIIYEANMRAIDPVRGCRKLILDLETSINVCRLELHFLLRQLYYYRAKWVAMMTNRNVYVPIYQTKFGQDIKPDVHQLLNQFSDTKMQDGELIRNQGQK